MNWDKPTFERPKGVRIVDMCIFIDKNFPVLMENHNQMLEDTIVKYLYLIIDSLAKKEHLFTEYGYYDDFALFLTSEIFCIMRKKWENQGKISRGREVVPIKSVLNFIKSVIYPYKVQFEQNIYSCIIMPEMVANSDELADDLRDQVRQQYIKDLKQQLDELIPEMPSKIKRSLDKICPYKRDPVMMRRIYISCILTLIENISIRGSADDKLTKNQLKKDIKKMLEAYDTNNHNVVLWKLPDHMENYIRFLVFRIKRIMSNELQGMRVHADISDEAIDAVIKTGFTTYDEDQRGL